MRTKKRKPALKFLAGILILVVLAACAAEVDGGKSTPALPTKTFWAQNLTNSAFYSFKADLLAEGERCKIWVEQASGRYCDSATAQKIADEYDTKIYPKMIDAFSIIEQKTEVGENIYVENIMELADLLVDGDGKLSILLLDIKDGFTPQNGSYTAGYFSAVNFLEDNNPSYHSNEADMIYLDTYPAEPGGEESYQTLAHEMQHLMNFTTSILKRSSGENIYLMDTWIDEGLSSAAEYIYRGDHVQERYEWFNQDPVKTIALGNNFFVWGNHNDASILDDYATVYLFFQWLRVQSEGQANDIYKDIIASQYPDYQAVTAAAEKNISWLNSTTWKDLFEPWLAANYINAGSGKYGYNNDASLKTVKAKTAPAGTTSLQLLPGEAAYSLTTSNGNTASYTSGSGANIKYAGLTNDGIVNSSPTYTYTGGALLTYNAIPSITRKPANWTRWKKQDTLQAQRRRNLPPKTTLA
ncbi:MAG: hypothetical protein LBF80_03980 [Spirochaetaceae bacterium]|jgi:hypothetical protein|nr:hypothetical protein [Spirochaetaceae bacterium]